MDEFGLNIAGGEDEADFCRGYGAETNEGYDENYFPVDDDDDYNSGTGAYTENEDLDKAPEMPQNFYKDVESFLMRDPPKLKDTSRSKKTKSNNKKGVVLPDIYSKQSNEINPPQPPQVTSKVRSKLLNTTNKQPQRQFDHNLLRDAFAYTDQLLKDALMEEASSTNSGNHESSTATGQQGLPPRRAMKKDTKGSSTGNGQKKLQSRTIPVESIYMAPHPHSAPSGSSNTKKKTDIYSSNSGYHSSTGSSNSGPKGIVKKLRAKVPSESNISTTNNTNTGFSTDTTLDNNNNKRNAVNFDELISNFQDGIMLSKLRQELEVSKQSMKKSENFMRQLSQEYLGKGKKF